MTQRILIVEDELKLAQLLNDYLQASGFSCQHIADGGQVMAQLTPMPDLILLDLMLPNVDGITLCRQIRQISTVPIIMLTARVDEVDRLLGLELGADDYICKPYSPREVVARVKAVLRRVAGQLMPSVKLQLDERRLSVIYQGNEVALSAVEFHLFALMARHPGCIYNRQQLMDSMYSDNRLVSDRTIDSHIKKIRKKLHEALGEQELVQSVYGAGYRVVLQ